MKATCPKDLTHDRFLTTAHVMELWLVDPEGGWVETRECMDTTHAPDPGNTWTCAICGAEATVVA